MIIPKITKQNVLLFAMSHYNNPQCLSLEEFKDDVRKCWKFNKALSRTPQNLTLALNYCITINNVFGPYATSRLVFFYATNKNYEKIKTILYFLNILPDYIPEINLNNIKLDKNILNELINI